MHESVYLIQIIAYKAVKLCKSGAALILESIVILCPFLCVAGTASVCNILGNIIFDMGASLGLILNAICYIFIYLFFMSCVGGISKEDTDWVKNIFVKS